MFRTTCLPGTSDSLATETYRYGMRSNPFELSVTTTARRLTLGDPRCPHHTDRPDCHNFASQITLIREFSCRTINTRNDSHNLRTHEAEWQWRQDAELEPSYDCCTPAVDRSRLQRAMEWLQHAGCGVESLLLLEILSTRREQFPCALDYIAIFAPAIR